MRLELNVDEFGMQGFEDYDFQVFSEEPIRRSPISQGVLLDYIKKQLVDKYVRSEQLSSIQSQELHANIFSSCNKND